MRKIIGTIILAFFAVVGVQAQDTKQENSIGLPDPVSELPEQTTREFSQMIFLENLMRQALFYIS